MNLDEPLLDTPADAVSAATHPDPYPFYARLVASRPLQPDPVLGVRVAAGAAAVEEVLTHPACRVRPAAEPVPAALLHSPAGEIFRHLVRMNDGRAHCPLKRAVGATMDSLDGAILRAAADQWAHRLARGIGPESDSTELTPFAFALSAHTLGSLLGVAGGDLPQAAAEVGELVRCVLPGGTPEQVERGKIAAGRLRERFRRLLADGASGADGTLLRQLAAEARSLGPGADDAVVCNAIGFLLQAYDATAGLVGNTMLALAREPEVGARVAANPAVLPGVVAEVARHDAPIQNTRRFVVEPAILCGERVAAGETVLVLLAAANRDPAANPDPHRFHSGRAGARSFTFGAGPHACPGREVATILACAGVARLLANGVAPAGLDPSPRYHVSANARIPILARRTANPHGGAG